MVLRRVSGLPAWPTRNAMDDTCRHVPVDLAEPAGIAQPLKSSTREELLAAILARLLQQQPECVAILETRHTDRLLAMLSPTDLKAMPHNGSDALASPSQLPKRTSSTHNLVASLRNTGAAGCLLTWNGVCSEPAPINPTQSIMIVLAPRETKPG
jgi:hypothetical protein